MGKLPKIYAPTVTGVETAALLADLSAHAVDVVLHGAHFGAPAANGSSVTWPSFPFARPVSPAANVVNVDGN